MNRTIETDTPRYCPACQREHRGKFFAVITRGRFRYYRCEACEVKRNPKRN